MDENIPILDFIGNYIMMPLLVVAILVVGAMWIKKQRGK
jgi:hypothetical protein